MKQRIKRIVLILCFLLSFICVLPAHASCGCRITYADGTEKDVLGVETIIFGNADGCSCEAEPGDNITKILLLIINILEVLVGILGVIGISIAGLVYLTAGGREEQVRKAKQRLLQIVIGIAVFSVLWSLSNWLIPGGVFNSDPASKVDSITALGEDDVAKLEEEKHPPSSSSSDGLSSSVALPPSSSTTKFVSEDYDNTSGTYLNYLLLTPNTAANNRLPLIVHLHGKGDSGNFNPKNVVGIKTFVEWENTGLDGINAYVLFPQVKDPNQGWSCDYHQKYRDELWDKIKSMVDSGKVDSSKIVISGHSMGTHGVQCLIDEHQGQFSASTLFAGYKRAYFDLYKAPPMKFIYGYYDETGVKENVSAFQNYSHIEVKKYSDKGHGNVIEAALIEDLNGDHKSDLIEWMLSQTAKSPISQPASSPTASASTLPASSPSTTFVAKDTTTGTYANSLLFTPSTASGHKLPLIIYLHGDSGPATSVTIANLKGIVGITEFTNWESNSLNGINAYILFPQAKTKDGWRCAAANGAAARSEIWTQVKNLVNSGKVDPYRISIMGQSSGSYGVQCFLKDYPDQFSAAALLSGYRETSIGLDLAKVPPMKVLYGSLDSGAKTSSDNFKNYSHIEIKEYPGENHDTAVKAALLDDSNPTDGKSDLIEWALSKTSKLPVQ